MAKNKSTRSGQRRLLIEPSGQLEMFEKSYEQEVREERSRKVECLGMTFENDDARTKYFLDKLREALEELESKLGGVPFTTVDDAIRHLKSVKTFPMGDELRLHEMAERMRSGASKTDLLGRWKDEVGFPHGDIENILSLSDPPYYTACPNPFSADFVRCYGTSHDPQTPYNKEPFATDVSEGKSDPIYTAHSYHTKVPHKAIMRYVLHYTEPGDLVFDGFCGTGMTGVAAQLCGDQATVESLGYHLLPDGSLCLADGESVRLGARHALICDLSPVATFISCKYNVPGESHVFERNAASVLKRGEDECNWMYQTRHPKSKLDGRINYVVWSDVFLCSECSGEVVFWREAVDRKVGKVREQFPCPQCKTILCKRSIKHACVTRLDKVTGQTIRTVKQVPVFINYTVGKARYEKEPDKDDLALIETIEKQTIPHWFPADRLPEGDEARRNDDIGITHVHHFFTKRNLWALSALYTHAKAVGLGWLVTGILPRASKQHQIAISRVGGEKAGEGGATAGHRRGTLYVPSNQVEFNPFELIAERLKIGKKAAQAKRWHGRGVIIGTQSATHVPIPTNSVDYVFTDPPFGGNIMYSELNFIWEAFLRVFTNNSPEAVTNVTQAKGLPDYQRLMTQCFAENYRILKPGRWMTVEFHNSQNAVWASIQEALQAAGFVIADVRTLDKKIKTHTQRTAAGSVNQDLAITSYKPSISLEERFRLDAGTKDGVWDFVRSHLEQVPGFVSNGGQVQVIAERQDYLLFDRMVAFHVQRGVTVPMSAAEFYAGLAQRFIERDDMYFLPAQAAEYDKRRASVSRVEQLVLIPRDEESAIQWLRQQLRLKPQSFQDIHPVFMRAIAGFSKHEEPLELRELLEQNFLCYDGNGEVPSQIHGYLSHSFRDLRNLVKDDPVLRRKALDRWYVPDPKKAGDLERLRSKALLKEFKEYGQSKMRRLMRFRLEAMRAGFADAYQRQDYRTIVDVAEKIPETVLQEDQKLLMYYDVAKMRLGTE